MDKLKRIEITRRKVEDADGFQAMDPVRDSEEPEIAEYYNVDEKDRDNNQKLKEGNKENSKSKKRR
jgi:hypothetical protein